MRAAAHRARHVLALGAVTACLHAHALQVLEAVDGVAVEAIVAQKEPTRIRVEGTPITDVVGNIQSSRCAKAASPPEGAVASGLAAPAAATSSSVNPGGDVIVECDADRGEIYVRPAGDSARPINLFVSTATATYTLLLRRADTPADTIVIRDKTPRALRSGAPEPVAAGPAPSHIRTMKALLVAMASERVPADIRVEETSRPVQLWAEVRFTLQRVFEGRGLVGEKYALQNISLAPMVLAEQEFDRPDSQAAGEIAGIAIEHHNLLPGESTAVYVIRRGGSR